MSLSSILDGVNNLTAKIDGITFPQSPPPSSEVTRMAAETSGAPLSLGDFHFVSSMDGALAPSRIDFGMEHNFTIHTLIGGREVVDANGAKPIDITFSGIIIGPHAAEDARQLRHLAEVAEIRPLVWGEENYDVLVRKAKTSQQQPFLFKYDVECKVMAVNPPASEPTVEAVTKSDVREAISSLPATDTGIKGILGNAEDALDAVGKIADTGGQFLSTFITAKSQIEARVQNVQSAIRAIGSIGDQASTTGLIGAMQSAQSSFNALGKLSASAGYLGRTIHNVGGS